MSERGDKTPPKKRDAKTGRADKAQSKKRGWFKFISFLGVLCLAFLTGGFITFAQHIDKLTPPATSPKADGIVVWTGKGGGRLEAGAELLSGQKGERLLISGVNSQIDMPAIKALISIDEDLADCCIDLDYAATNTTGNAAETAAWAKALGYEHVLLVTSAYHMPRAQVEIGRAAGRIRITPYPVKNPDNNKWYSDKSRFKRVGQEYAKLLISYAKGRNSKSEAPVLAPIKP